MPDNWIEQHTGRSDKIHYYSFAILTDRIINEIAPYGPFLEVGAGTGYWAWEFQKRNIDYIATEPDQKGEKEQPKKTIWVKMEPLSALDSIKKYPGRTLLICWPSYNDCWAYHALKAYTGSSFIYVGEGDGGCTADDLFHEELNKNWEVKKQFRSLQWYGIHDEIYIYGRINKKCHRKIVM
jgi:hypothetical protein